MNTSSIFMVGTLPRERSTEPLPLKKSRLIRYFLTHVSDDFKTIKNVKEKKIFKNVSTFFVVNAYS